MIAQYRYLSSVIIFCVAMSSPVGAGEAKANKLMVEAAQAAASVSATSLPEIKLAALRKAVGNLEAIISDHSTSSLAVRLATGQSVGNINLAVLKSALDVAQADVDTLIEEQRVVALLNERIIAAEIRHVIIQEATERRKNFAENMNAAAQQIGADWTFDYPPMDQLPDGLIISGVKGWEDTISNLVGGETFFLLGEGPDFDSGELKKFVFQFNLGPNFDGDLRLEQLGLPVITKGDRLIIDEPLFDSPFSEWGPFDFYDNRPVLFDKLAFFSIGEGAD